MENKIKAYKNSRVTVVYCDNAETDFNIPCEAILRGDGSISIRYKKDDEWYAYQGHEPKLSSGHYVLRATRWDNERATLHRAFPGSSILEGYWNRGCISGFWRITLEV